MMRNMIEKIKICMVKLKSTLATALMIIFPVSAIASDALNPALIFNLKKGHKSSCVPTIQQQLKSIGMDNIKAKAIIYCDCLGILYFNEFTESDYAEMKANNRLPEHTRNNRKQFQEYCADLNLY